MALVTSADTVAWWRFGDLGPAGGKVSAVQTFTNRVDAAKFPAYAASFKNVDPAGSDADWLPAVTAPFGDVTGVRLFDPVAGESVGFSMALSCPWGGDGSGLSGGAYVEPSPALIGQADGDSGDFTVECFFKTTEAGLARSAGMEALVGQKSPSWFGGWSLLINGRRLWSRYSLADSPGATSSDYANTPNGSTDVTPGVWHHAAFVFSASTAPHVKVYLDYRLETTGATEDGTKYVAPGADQRIYIGKGRYNDDRSFEGEIADVRISNAALEPKDFLRFEGEDAGDRAAGWISLDGADSFGPEFFAANAGLNTSFAPVVTATLENGDAYGYSFATDVLDSRIRDTFLGGDVRANAAALHVTTNASADGGTKDCAYVKISDQANSYVLGDFTQEFWFRTDGQNDGSEIWGLACAPFFKAVVLQYGTFLFRFKGTAGDQDYMSNSRVDDGNWHHVALVVDRTAQTTAVYLDYVLIGSKTGVDLKTTGTTPWTFGAARESASSPQTFSGSIDEIRLTRRALDVTEFMGFGPLPGKTLLRLRFEDDADAWPYNLRERNFAVMNPGMSKPWYTNGVFRPKLDYRDAATGVVANERALAFAGGRARLDETPAIHRSNVTIEFFVRLLGRAAPWPTLVGYTGDSEYFLSSQEDSTSSWGISFKGTWDYAQLVFWMKPATDSGAGTSVPLPLSPQYAFADLSHKGDAVGYGTIALGSDNRWRHAAVTLEEVVVDGATATRVTTWWNYRKVETKDVPGTLYLPEHGYLTFGAHNYSNRFADFMIDELRISAGTLTVDEFIHKTPTGGVLIVR